MLAHPHKGILSASEMPHIVLNWSYLRVMSATKLPILRAAQPAAISSLKPSAPCLLAWRSPLTPLIRMRLHKCDVNRETSATAVGYFNDIRSIALGKRQMHLNIRVGALWGIGSPTQLLCIFVHFIKNFVRRWVILMRNPLNSAWDMYWVGA